VVELSFVDYPAGKLPEPPIGVLSSLTTGFDRVAARPALMLPPLVLDTLLWLGPRLRITALLSAAVATVTSQLAVDPSAANLVDALQLWQKEDAIRVNVLAALSSLPIGIPSLMAIRMPAIGPLGSAAGIEVPGMGALVGLWFALTLAGVGLGSAYHIWAARLVAPRSEVSPLLSAWARLAVLAFAGYLAAFVLVFIILLVSTLLASLDTTIGMIGALAGASLIFWVAVYFMFSPHGIVRYRLGVLRSLVESAQVVRWNMVSTGAFVVIALGINWLTSWVWSLPGEDSWYSLLAVVGHAFVSTTLVVGSYAFYQGRREWTVKVRQLLADRRAAPPRPPEVGL
jgi:hypothetical protein